VESKPISETNKFGRRFDREFKENAVRLLGSSERSLADVARELGISVWSLSRWRQLFAAAPAPSAAPPEPSDPQRQIQPLQQQLDYVTEQRDILKKALAICSSEQKRPGNSNW